MTVAQRVQEALVLLAPQPGDSITETYAKQQVLQKLLKVRQA